MLSSDTRPYLRHPWQSITVLDTSLLQHVILPYDTNSDTNIADVQSVPTPFLCIAYSITIVAFDIHFIYEYLCITSQGSFVWFVGVSPKCVIPLWSVSPHDHLWVFHCPNGFLCSPNCFWYVQFSEKTVRHHPFLIKNLVHSPTHQYWHSALIVLPLSWSLSSNPFDRLSVHTYLQFATWGTHLFLRSRSWTSFPSIFMVNLLHTCFRPRSKILDCIHRSLLD